jgi:hypothetical protein
MSGNIVKTQAALAPHVLRKAGVPIEDSLWLARQNSARQMKALQTPRGGRILDHVREFMHQVSISQTALGA